ncbi:Methionyl-tRNA formyltransferase [Coemansia sp. IMI 209128]|nr:Methionyl-tRNA formyltransferase [Coemansia sp. RSA 2530]KAJ2697222.1 Methionyl-tRNA formyltransferase [Coemansia sp. IMI 209128]
MAVAAMYMHARQLTRCPTRFSCRRALSVSAPALGLKVLFFGSDEFADRVLRELDGNRTGTQPCIEHMEVVCPQSNYYMKREKKVYTYQSPVHKLALKKGLNVHHPLPGSMSSWMIPLIDGGNIPGQFDIGIVASFGRFLPSRIINGFKKGMINIHPSLLPKYRGPSPIQTAILNGDPTSGVTIQEIHPSVIDGGKVLAQAPYPIPETAPYGQLVDEMGTLGGQLTVKVLRDLENIRGKSIEQDESQVSHTRMFDREDSVIVWERMTAEDIFRVHRTFYQKEPVHTCMRIKNKVKWVQFLELSVAPEKTPPINAQFLDFPPGSVFYQKKVPYVEISCLGGGRIHATRFRVSGKAERDPFQFIAGYVKAWKDKRMITRPINTKHLTPPFAYPEGYVKPTSYTDAYKNVDRKLQYCADLATKRLLHDAGYSLASESSADDDDDD